MLRNCLLFALAVFVLAQEGDNLAWCNTELTCIKDGELEKDEPVCSETGENGAKMTSKNMCTLQRDQCLKQVMEVRAMIGACPVSCQNDGDCSDNNVCKKVDKMGVPCNGNENSCFSSCEKKQETVDMCKKMVENNDCPKAIMACRQKEECTDKGCQYSATCEPLDKPDDCKIQGVQQCINSQMRQQAMGMKGKFDTCTLLNIYTVCGKNNGCGQTYMHWCLHGLPPQPNMPAANQRTYPDNCDLPACEGGQCDVKAYRECINGIAGGDLKEAYNDCGKLLRILTECAVPQKCNVLYNCFQFKKNGPPGCDLSSICGRMQPALEEQITNPILVRFTKRPTSNHKAVAIVTSCFGVIAVVGVIIAVVMKRRRAVDGASYTRAVEMESAM